MTSTMEQKVMQLQQELFTLKAQVAARVQIAAAVQARLLTTAQVRKDAPSPIDVNDPGRPKKFSGFFVGVIKESGMMLEWAAEQTTEISTELINREFLLIATNQERGVQNVESVLQQMHATLMALTSREANDTVANSRKNPFEAWRRLQKRYDPTTGGRKRNLLRTITSPGRCSFLELQAGMERWESYVSRYEKKLKDKLDDICQTMRSSSPVWRHWCLRSLRSI